MNNVVRVTAYQVNYLVFNLFWHCVWHVNFVDYRNNLQIMVNGKMIRT